MIRKNSCILFGLVLIAGLTSGVRALGPAVDAPAAFDRLKAREGTWESTHLQANQIGRRGAMDKFMLLLHDSPGTFADVSPEQMVHEVVRVARLAIVGHQPFIIST